jgi:hypothetical protein
VEKRLADHRAATNRGADLVELLQSQWRLTNVPPGSLANVGDASHVKSINAPAQILQT